MSELWTLVGVALGTIVLSLLVLTLLTKIKKKKSALKHSQTPKSLSEIVPKQAAESINIDSILNDEFRQELRNRGRMQFEKSIREASDALNRDLARTTGEVHQVVAHEINASLKSEFSKYEASIKSARDMTLQSISAVQAEFRNQQQAILDEMRQDLKNQQNKILSDVYDRLGTVISDYLNQALGEKVDLESQLPEIIKYMEDNRQQIEQEIKHA